MNKLTLEELCNYVNQNIDSFHNNKLSILKSLNLTKLLKTKNPYLFRAKNITLAQDLIKEILNAKLSSSEEELFGRFLEDLAIFIAQKTKDGHKSSSQGIDLEFDRKNIHYLVTIKSGSNWGNSSQWKAMVQDFNNAQKVLMQSNHLANVKNILGICYGKSKPSIVRNSILKLTGQNFWYFISGDSNLYIDIIEPLGYKAKEHNSEFLSQRDIIINSLTDKFLADFCNQGIINWEKIVEFNSGTKELINLE